MLDSVDWRVRKGPGPRQFSDRVVVQGGSAGMLELSICLLASRSASRRMLGLLVPLAAACASEGIRRDTGIVSWLHWPNLVTIDGRVVAETSVSLARAPESRGRTQVVMNISVDCFSPGPGTSSALPSTSILTALGVEIDVAMLREKVLHAVNWYYAEWERGMNQKLAERMRPTIAWLGRDVEVRTAEGQVIRGRAIAMDDFGSLVLGKEGSRGSRTARALPPDGVEFVSVVD